MTYIEFLVLLGSLAALFLVRNNATYRARIWFIENHYDLYDSLPGYDEMLLSPRFLLFWKPTHWLAWLDRQQTGESA